jgi:hypothetical protein
MWEIGIGVVAAFVWALLVVIGRWVARAHRFGRFHGRYVVSDKYDLIPTEGTNAPAVASDGKERDWAVIRVRGAVLHVEYHTLAEEVATGEIAMDEGLSRVGRGSYVHPSVSGDGFGFWDVQTDGESNLFVHTTYVRAHAQGTVVQGYTWTRVTPKRSIAHSLLFSLGSRLASRSAVRA